MTGIELAAAVVLIICAVTVLLLLYAALGMLADWLAQRRRQKRPDLPTLTDIRLTATRETVLPGQATDIRLHFTVLNPERNQVSYSATLEVADLANTDQSNPGFTQDSMTTAVLRAGAKWSTTGTKRVFGKISVLCGTALIQGSIEGAVNVVTDTD